MTKFPELFSALFKPFDHSEVKSRQQAGRTLHYVTARTVANRLDAVLGPENWWDEYIASEHSVLCKLTVRLPDGTTLTKADAGGYAGMSDQGDDDKSGYSDAFKRAAVKFGVARYLYRDGVPDFVRSTAGDSPELMPVLDAGPRQATPGAPQPGPRRPASSQAGRGNGQPPRTGRALFAWAKDQGQRLEVDLLQYLTKWGKLNGFPARMVDWDGDQVARAYQEANRKMAADEVEVDRAAARDAD